ncbi:MAG: hypothetical protein HY821_00330 [Acidobacteria bacterium]|nr:hypothetical protein [Acidobacteriota bacterium]
MKRFGGPALAAVAMYCLMGTAWGQRVRPVKPVEGLGSRNIQQTTDVINDCERRTGAFQRKMRRALNRSGLNRTAREDQLNRDTDRLESAMDKVGDSWNRDHDVHKTRQFVSGAIAVARDINKTMVNWHLDSDAEQEWVAVRGELNRLAQTFGLPKVGW